MAETDNHLAEVTEVMNRFNDLANQIKNEGKSTELVNTALMLASCHYATYIVVGNQGYLQPSGVEKVTATYRHNLSELQLMRKKRFNPDAKT